jgi:hypothetical protein
MSDDKPLLFERLCQRVYAIMLLAVLLVVVPHLPVVVLFVDPLHPWE